MERKNHKEGDGVKTWFSQLKAPMAGGISGFCTRALTQPLDCIKVRHQLQLEPIKQGSTAKYTSTLQTLVLMFKEEGVRGLWKGHVPGILRIEVERSCKWVANALSFGPPRLIFFGIELLTKKN
jgi:Mitochondrial carrier protein